MSIDLVRQFAENWQSGTDPPDVFEFLASRPNASVIERLDVLLHDQRRRWLTSRPINVEEYLARLPELAVDAQIKLQLAVGEFQARQQTDTVPRIDEFTSRFPDLADSLQSQLSAIASGRPGRPIELATTTQSFVAAATIGDQLLGRYRLVRLLGEGAFGRVWLALDDQLQRQVAIKVPTPERFQRPEDAETYLTEARTVASLDHPHIVPVYDVGRAPDGSVYVVSKFIDGPNLSERLKRGRLTASESASILGTVAQALHHAHQKRLIHRDIKSANILLDESTKAPYLADFGLAIREEDYLRGHLTAGTPAYMSPEQARGEGHRLDGRSDIFSLGVVLYELLTGKRPFRGSTHNEVLHQVTTVDPVPPREMLDSIPAELERICLKALSKRASDRYATAADLADDLSHWDSPPTSGLPSPASTKVVPKGLRSFDADDADFFLDLLPGPRNRDGLPESIAFWKSRIEQTDPEKTFSVGLIYGPSGCGKSSLVKAGLLPRLSPDMTAIYVEATADDTETRILRGVRKRLPELPTDLGLVETLTALRLRAEKKVVIVLDQFEQWLHARRAEAVTELAQALRQCDGGSLQAVVMVRDDFAMAAARFMDSLDVPIVQGQNFATVDRFDTDHAEKVLAKFGQAFGKLPAQATRFSEDEREFLKAIAAGLAEDGKVVSVRLSLFAEMIKGKPWVPATLRDVGGAQGIGVVFLDETFSSRTANPKHRLHQQAARAVLKALLPEVSTDIKGHMRSYADLLAASGYRDRLTDFGDLLRVLDGELRLITPTDPEGHASQSKSDSQTQYFQLTHDYLVPSLRDWLTRKQKETRRGRAELRLEERAATWNAKPENRYLPSAWEYLSIVGLTTRRNWSESQRKMMARAGKFHGLWATGIVLLLAVGTASGLAVRHNIQVERERLQRVSEEKQNLTNAQRLVESLANADTQQVPEIVKQLDEYSTWAEPLLVDAFAQAQDGSAEKLHLSLALARKNDGQIEYLYQELLLAGPSRFPVIRDALDKSKDRVLERLWTVLTSRDKDPEQHRLRAAGALAQYDPHDAKWEEVASEVASQLVAVNPVFVGAWQEALRPVSDRLLPPLTKIFSDPEQSELPRTLATSLLADYAKGDPERLTNLIVVADAKPFATLFPVLQTHGAVAVEKLLAVLARKVEPTWHDPPLDPSWVEPPPAARAAIEAAHGMLDERFAFCQDMPWEELVRVAETLRASGYRPTRVRPAVSPLAPVLV